MLGRESIGTSVCAAHIPGASPSMVFPSCPGSCLCCGQGAWRLCVISGVLQSSKCSDPQDALVPKVLGSPVSMGPQGSPVPTGGGCRDQGCCWHHPCAGFQPSAALPTSVRCAARVSHMDPFPAGEQDSGALSHGGRLHDLWVAGCPVLPHVPALGDTGVPDQLPAW